MKIKELRLKHNLKQRDVAKFLHIGQSNYSQIELGITTPNIFLLIKLSKLYNVSVDYIIDNEVETYPIFTKRELKELENHYHFIKMLVEKFKTKQEIFNIGDNNTININPLNTSNTNINNNTPYINKIYKKSKK